MSIPSFHDEECWGIGVEDLSGAAALGAVAPVGALEVVEPEPGGQVGVDVLGPGVEPVPEGRPVVQVQDGALEPLHEGVQVRGPGRELAPADPQGLAPSSELALELRPAVDHHLLQSDPGLGVGREDVVLQELGGGAGTLLPRPDVAKPKEQAPSTAEYCQTFPTPLRLPTYMVSRNTCSPSTSEPMWRWVTSRDRSSRRTRSVIGPPSEAARASAAANRAEVRSRPARRSTL